MVMQTPPRWRIDPEKVWVKCNVIQKSSLPGELVVQFKVNGDEFTAFVPDSFVNQSKKALMGFIVADVGQNWQDWLIDLPMETLTSGPRIRVAESEKSKVIFKALE